VDAAVDFSAKHRAVHSKELSIQVPPLALRIKASPARRLRKAMFATPPDERDLGQRFGAAFEIGKEGDQD
jgi:hypothetical protein